MSVLQPPPSRRLSGRQKTPACSVIASGQTSTVTGPRILQLCPYPPMTSDDGCLVRIQYDEQEGDDEEPGRTALLCRVLEAVGSSPPVYGTSPGIPQELERHHRRGSAHPHQHRDEFWLHEPHRQPFQLPIVSRTAAISSDAPPAPPPPPPPPPPDSQPARPVTIQVTPASPEAKVATITTPPASGAREPGAPVSPPAAAETRCNGAPNGWECAWSRRRRRRRSTDSGADGLAVGAEHSSECLMGLVSAVIALLVTAGVIYWVYRTHLQQDDSDR